MTWGIRLLRALAMTGVCAYRFSFCHPVFRPFVIPAKAGIQNVLCKDWIPCQARNDKKREEEIRVVEGK